MRQENNFTTAYREFEFGVRNDLDLKKQVELIALLGSVSQKEQSDSWSDLDILIVLKSDGFGNISLTVLNKIRDIASLVSTNHPDVLVSVLPHTIDDFSNYVCFEYLQHYSSGICTYPSKVKLAAVINRILRKRNVSEQVRKAYCVYHLRHIRFNLLRKYISVNKSNSQQPTKEFGKLLIDKVIKVTDLWLNYQNIWPKTKNDILKNAKIVGSLNTEPLAMALQLRDNWSRIEDKKVDDFIPVGIEYVKQATDDILNQHPESTPEERMSI